MDPREARNVSTYHLLLLKSGGGGGMVFNHECVFILVHFFGCWRTEGGAIGYVLYFLLLGAVTFTFRV